MPHVDLTSGPIEYVDTGGTGPVVVLTHGLPMSPTQWRKVLPQLDEYRCVLPTLPLGGHRSPMAADTDLSQFGMAQILGEFVERMDLHDVTLVSNDWGGSQFLLTESLPGSERVSRLALVACEAFDNFPPGPARRISTVAKVPGGIWMLLQLLRLKPIRKAPNGFGGMSRRGVPDDIMDEWLWPAQHSRAIRRDFAKFARGTPPRETLLAAGERLRDVDLPALVVWASDDPLMPRDHGVRLAEMLPRARLVEIEDSATLIPEDQPDQLAVALKSFLATEETASSG